MAELPEQPEIVVHGAGSIGCWIGGTWRAAGLAVTLLGRKKIADEIAANGLTLTDNEKRRIELRPDEISVATNPKALRKANVIVLAVKSMGTAAAAAEIAKYARKGATVISFQNGVSNVDVLKGALPGFTVLQAMVPFNVAAMGNGRWHKGLAGALWAEDHDVTRALAARIGARPDGLTLSADMTGVAWSKLLVNLNNAVNALSGRALLEELGNRDYRRVWAAAQIEGLDLLKAAGIEPAKLGPFPPRLFPHIVAAPDWLFNSTVLKLYRIDANARSSMADDFAAGRPTEIDWLNGEVVRLAAKLGRKAPVNDAIVGLVRQAEAGVEKAWGGKELHTAVVAGHGTVLGY